MCGGRGGAPKALHSLLETTNRATVSDRKRVKGVFMVLVESDRCLGVAVLCFVWFAFAFVCCDNNIMSMMMGCVVCYDSQLLL